MIRLLLTTVVIFQVTVAAAETRPLDLIEIARGTTAEFVFVASANCRTIYFQPRLYSVNTQQSAKLQMGSLNRVIAVLEPKPAIPDDRQKQEILTQLSPSIPSCPGTFDFQSYPAALTSLSAGDIKAEPLGQGRWSLSIDLPVGQFEKRYPTYFSQPRIELTTFRRDVLAKISLNAEYHASAEFFQKYWTERKCTIKEKRVLAWVDRKENCEEIQKVSQYLQNAEFESKIQLVEKYDVTYPRSRLGELRSRILSRWALSSFTTLQAIRIHDTLFVTFGDLRKNAYDIYSDEVEDERMRTESYGASSELSGLMEFIGGRL